MNISFVTGKGGVGKTRISLLLAQKQKNCVLSETADHLADEARELKIKPPKIHHFSRADLTEEFLSLSVKIPGVAHWLGKNAAFQTLLQLAPNLNELLLLHKWCRLAEKQPLIVDAPATGHFLSLFEGVRTAQTLFDGGSLRRLADELMQKFTKGTGVKVYIVSLPETSALAEMQTIETYFQEHFPKIESAKVLNRKHEKPSPEVTDILTEPLSTLASLRPEREAERIKNFTFENTVAEGAVAL